MKFWEAMREMQENQKKVRYTGWVKDAFIDSYSDFAEKFGLLAFDPTIKMLNGDWEIYEDPSQEYKFSEVILLFKDGKKFKRKMWDRHFLFENFGHIFIRDMDLGFTSQWHPKIRDIQSVDWIEVKE